MAEEIVKKKEEEFKKKIKAEEERYERAKKFIDSLEDKIVKLEQQKQEVQMKFKNVEFELSEQQRSKEVEV